MTAVQRYLTIVVTGSPLLACHLSWWLLMTTATATRILTTTTSADLMTAAIELTWVQIERAVVALTVTPTSVPPLLKAAARPAACVCSASILLLKSPRLVGRDTFLFGCDEPLRKLLDRSIFFFSFFLFLSGKTNGLRDASVGSVWSRRKSGPRVCRDLCTLGYLQHSSPSVLQSTLEWVPGFYT